VNKKLSEIYSGVATNVTADDEHLAALSLLALVALADKELVPVERRTTEEIAADWREDLEDFAPLIEPAIAAAAEALADDEVDAFINGVDSEIKSRVLRSALYSAAREVAVADSRVTPEENSVLQQIAVQFA
jgi:uncharacterized tellurite resistance protein B-like protein